MQSLIVIKGTKHFPYELASRSVTIGQGSGNDIVLDDPEVSAKHCQVRLNSEKRWVLQDGGSTNGTYLNESLVRKATLQSGDKLRVGQTIILFVDRSRGQSKGQENRLQNLLILQEINKALNSETDLERLLELEFDELEEEEPVVHKEGGSQ